MEHKKKSFQVSVPGKTFLMGEYAVLEGGPALIINTQPCFLFSVTGRKKSAGHLDIPFPPQSPAGQWLRRYPEIGHAFHIKTHDPYGGRGGFGRSSAEFNLVYLLGQLLNLYTAKKNNEKNTFLSLWKDYRGLDFEGACPSGADVVSQWVGGLCVFCPRPFKVRSLSAWPFKGLDFFLLRTNITFPTHKHLKDLSQAKRVNGGSGGGASLGLGPCLFSDLVSIAKRATHCMEQKNQEGFVSAVDQYSLCLNKKNLVHPKALSLVKQIKKLKEVITARACGAMGAEVVAVFFAPEDKQKVQVFSKGKQIVAHSSHFSPKGLTHTFPRPFSMPTGGT